MTDWMTIRVGDRIRARHFYTEASPYDPSLNYRTQGNVLMGRFVEHEGVVEGILSGGYLSLRLDDDSVVEVAWDHIVALVGAVCPYAETAYGDVPGYEGRGCPVCAGITGDASAGAGHHHIALADVDRARMEAHLKLLAPGHPVSGRLRGVLGVGP